MALATPGIYVEAPLTLTPPGYGLFSAANVIVESDPHARGGVHYNPTVRGEVRYMDPDCTAADFMAEFDIELEWRHAPPITVYTGFQCKAPGVDWDDAEARLLTRLGNGEAPALEYAIWGGGLLDESGDAVGLMTADTQLLTSTAVDLTTGLGLLERHMYTQYPGTPVFHIPRELAPVMAERRQAEFKSGKAATPLGSSVSFGAYPNTGKTGQPSDAGTAWIVASGQVEVRRGDIDAHGTEFRTDGAGFEASTNTAFYLANRTDVVRWDGATVAVLVNL